MKDCINCIHGYVSRNVDREIKMGNTTIHQRGTYNIVCKNSGMSISFDKDGEMICSGFEKMAETWFEKRAET